MITSFIEYQRLAGQSDIIKQEYRLTYYPLWLNGEAGEVTEKVDDMQMSGSNNDKRLGLALELGDICWYIFRMLDLIDSECVCISQMDTPEHHQYYVRKFDHTQIHDRLTHYQRKISCHAGAVSDIVKKVIRDNNNILTDDKKQNIINHLMWTFEGVCLLSDHIGYPIGQVMQMNIDKLTSRMERGKIGGSGDHR